MLIRPSPADEPFLARAVELAHQTERAGNLPIGAVIILDGRVIAEGVNRTVVPFPHPGRHAEMLALAAIPEHLISRLPEMTCYTTLEPCVMCFGALVQHGIGRVVFGAADTRGGASALLRYLPRDVAAEVAFTQWEGPVWPEVCDPLFVRAAAMYWSAAPPETSADLGVPPHE